MTQARVGVGRGVSSGAGRLRGASRVGISRSRTRVGPACVFVGDVCLWGVYGSCRVVPCRAAGIEVFFLCCGLVFDVDRRQGQAEVVNMDEVES
jgi:hypothetical protein